MPSTDEQLATIRKELLLLRTQLESLDSKLTKVQENILGALRNVLSGYIR